MIHVENGKSNFTGEPIEIINDICALLIHFMKDKSINKMLDVAVAFLEAQAKNDELPDAKLTTNVKVVKKEGEGQFKA